MYLYDGLVIDKLSRAMKGWRNTFARDRDIFYDGFFLSKRESRFIRQGATIFFFLKHDRYSAPVIFFPLPAILTRSLAQTGLGGGRAGGRRVVEPTGTGSKEELSGFQARPGIWSRRRDLPHVNKDRASVAWCCPA